MFLYFRLDFIDFNIAGPSTSTVQSSNRVLGGSNSVVGTDVINARPQTDRTQCLTSQFSVTSPGNTAPPVICGQNDGQHSK